jgi:hypothetical protein
MGVVLSFPAATGVEDTQSSFPAIADGYAWIVPFGGRDGALLPLRVHRQSVGEMIGLPIEF